MNAQFHTPSFGDEVLIDLSDNETDSGNIGSVQGGVGVSNVLNNFAHHHQQNGQFFQHQQFESKRVRDMDVSVDEYHSANDESFPNNTNAVSPTKSAQNTPTATLAARKQLTPTATDANEPAKPLSAYGLFFRDTVSAIKQQNPNCTFPELSRIVLSMWEALDVSHKNVYSKKHEAALTEYMKQMRIYRQQQEERQQQEQQQQQQQQLAANVNVTPAPTFQTKPAVFTITRFSADGNSNINHNNFNSNNANAMQPQAQAPTSSADDNTSANDPSQPQIQMLSEAGAVQKCTRENCNKRAIINPDWEDEYCSNECVVIHCRNVFNAWVQSNMESRKQ